MVARSLKNTKKRIPKSSIGTLKSSTLNMADIAQLTELVKTLINEVKTLRDENRELHEKMDSLRDENRELHEKMDSLRDNMKTKTTRVPKVSQACRKCTSNTQKGTPCKNNCLPGKDVCAKHQQCPVVIQQPQPSTSSGVSSVAATKKPRVKKPTVKKSVPRHNHPIGRPPAEDVICELCETHGDILDPEMPDVEFEVVPVNGQSLEERLRIMLENELE